VNRGTSRRQPARTRPRRAGGAPSPFLRPASVEVRPRDLALGEGYCRTFAVTGYPREVGLGWLAPLLSDPGRLDVALHVDPVPPELAASNLRRQLARLESDRRIDAAKGRLADPAIDAAAEDARDLASRLARGEGKLFRAGCYVTVHARTAAALEAECTRVRALCASMLLDVVPATYRSLQGFATTLPLGIDALSLRRTMDTEALAAAFPFAVTSCTSPNGVLYGLDLSASGASSQGGGIVTWDRFAEANHNAVILARSGSGKSYLAKLEALRSLYRGIDVLVVDPEDEYRRLADAVGGAYIHLGAPGVRVNPFDLAPGPDALTRRALFVHTLLAVLLGKLDPAQTAALDQAVLATYAAAGITSDPRTHARPAPLLADLARMLGVSNDPTSRELASRLAPFVTGSYRGLFDGPTTTRPDGHLVVFSLRDLPDELKAAGTLLTLDAIWRRVADPTTRRRRIVVVDEAWLLMRKGEGASFLFRMAKSARKHWCGLTVVTQDAGDLLSSPLGQAVVANAATQVLLRQAPQVVDALAESFGLSAGEQRFLLSAGRGEGLLLGGGADVRVAFRIVASPAEDRLATTDPAALAALEGDDAPDLL
jgi:type IV secretory pathway VirB4 component